MTRQINQAVILTLAATLAVIIAFGQYEVASYAGTASHKVVYPGNEYSKNVKVDRTFAKNFSGAKNVLWKVAEDEFIANFKIEDRLAMAWFTKNGRLSCVNYYSDGKFLPEYEKKIVSQKYPDYDILATLEIDRNDIKAYIVTIQNCRFQKKVKLIDGDTEEMETLKLAK